MNPVLFGIVFGSIMVYLIVSFLRAKEITVIVPAVKAGKVTDSYHKEETLKRNLPRFINVNGERVDVSRYIVLYVHGESMKKYKIHDGQLIFVKPFGSSNVENRPVLVFKIVNPEPNEAEYKLRKFICQIDSIENVDWSTIYEQNKDRISIPKEDFIEKCQDKVIKAKDCLEGKIILSETYDVSDQKDCYSLHPLSTVFGTVEYAA